MPRIYHSPSSIALARRCRHAWALCYIAGIRDPEVAWEAITQGATHTSRQRSTALGKAMHTVGERWYLRDPKRPPDWRGLPGQIFLSGTVYRLADNGSIDFTNPARIEPDLNLTALARVRDYDVVIGTDFGHGMINGPAVEILANQAKFLAINTQSNSRCT